MKKRKSSSLTVFNAGKPYIPIPDKRQEINLTRDVVSVIATRVLAGSFNNVSVDTLQLFCNRDIYIKRLHVFTKKTIAATGVPIINLDYSLRVSGMQFNVNGVTGTSVSASSTVGTLAGNGAANNQHDIDLFVLANTPFSFSCLMYEAGVIADIYDLEILIEFEA